MVGGWLASFGISFSLASFPHPLFFSFSLFFLHLFTEMTRDWLPAFLSRYFIITTAAGTRNLANKRSLSLYLSLSLSISISLSIFLRAIIPRWFRGPRREASLG